MAISEASEVSLRSQLRTAEAGISKLKDEAAKQKVLVAQTRAACANEVRKRERQIEGLKKAVGEAGRARGVGRGGGVLVTVEGSPGAVKVEGGGDTSFASAGMDGLYDLRSETNAFLAELAKGLSEENENLLGLVRKTMGRLKEMSGWEGLEGEGVGVAEMAGEIDAILEHLRTILTNPSFVPIEEVVVREDEICRLRQGWEKMETRWQEAVHLIDGWKRRMQVSGRAVGIEELKMGLRLSPVRVRDVEETGQGMGLGIGKLRLGLEGIVEGEEGDELRLVPAVEDDGSDVSSIFEDEVLDDDDFDVGELDVDEPNVEILEQSVMFDSPPLPEPPQLSPLRDNYAAGNRGGARKRPGDHFTTIIEERTSDLRDEAPMPPPHGHVPQQTQSPRKKPSRQQIRAVPVEEEVEAAAGLATSSSSLDSLLLQKPADEVPPPAPIHKEQKASDQKPPPAAPAHKEQAKPKEKPLPKPPVPTRQERQEKERRKPPVPRQPVPARKPLRSNPARGANKTAERAKESGSGKESPVAPSTRTVSAASAVSIATTADTTVDTSSTSFTSNANSNNNVNSKEKSTGISPDRDTAMMPPPPLPIPSPSKPDSTSELCKSPKRAGGNSRLPLPRPGSNSNLRGDAMLHGMGLGLLPPPQQSPLSMATIQAKLAASEREADAARVRAKLKAVRLGAQKRASLVTDECDSRPGSALSAGASGKGKRAEVDDEVDELAADNGSGSTSKPASPAKRLTRARKPLPLSREEEAKDVDGAEEEQVPAPVVRKREKRVAGTGSRRASRRRSTLNPWELETLMKGGVEAEGVLE